MNPYIIALKKEEIITAIPEEPFNNKVGRRAGKSDGSFCELSKFGTKSTCNMKELNDQAQSKRKKKGKKGTIHFKKSTNNSPCFDLCQPGIQLQ